MGKRAQPNSDSTGRDDDRQKKDWSRLGTGSKEQFPCKVNAAWSGNRRILTKRLRTTKQYKIFVTVVIKKKKRNPHTTTNVWLKRKGAIFLLHIDAEKDKAPLFFLCTIKAMVFAGLWCLWWYFLVAGGYKLRTGNTVNIVWNTGEKKCMMHIRVH